MWHLDSIISRVWPEWLTTAVLKPTRDSVNPISPDHRSVFPEDVEWTVSPGLTDYEAALRQMEARNGAIAERKAREQVWLLEHDHVYTAGTSADRRELLDAGGVPVFETGRGGRYTYHGPGQRVGYVMLDLGQRGRDVRAFVMALESWLIATLAGLGVAARLAEGRIGLWVDTPSGEAKIAAIGLRVRRWVTMHGFAVNLDPDLLRFAGIVPCGIAEHGVTSMAALGRSASMETFDAALRNEFGRFLAALGESARQTAP